MTKLDLIEDEYLVDLFSKKGCNKYYDSDGAHKLVFVFENFQSLSKIFNESITLSLNTGVFNPNICDSKLRNTFEDISLQKHNYQYINKQIKVYEMKISEDTFTYHILTSVGIISVRTQDIYCVSVTNAMSNLNNHFIVTIKTFKGDFIQINFNSKTI